MKIVHQSLRTLSRIGLAFLCIAAAARAQSSGTGTISGRVYNPADKQYVQNAEVRVQGSANAVVTADGGYYRLLNVPAGPATVTVSYTGFQAPAATVNVTAGQTATNDFTLQPTGATATAANPGEKVVTLEAFTVSAEKEGDAKMIQAQKLSMNMTNMVSSETFGNFAEGNVGEFLQYLPAIDVDYVEADARNPRVRGLPAQYTEVTYNGMTLASADGFIQSNGTDNSGGAGAGDRSFGFESVSMSNVDAIEVNYTSNASQDASAPAGIINLIPKHAYERQGQEIDFNAQAMWDSESAYGKDIIGPDDTKNSQIRPNGGLTYLNSFFNNRLGVVVALNSADTWHAQEQFAPTYDTVPTAADPRPAVLTGLIYKDGPTDTRRQTASFTIDFKATDDLSFSVMQLWTGYQSFVGNRTWGAVTTRAAIDASGPITGDGLSSWTNVPITTITSNMAYLNKRTYGHTFEPTMEWKHDNLDVNAKASISSSVNNYAGGESAQWPGNTALGTVIPVTGMTVSATHPGAQTGGNYSNAYAWTVTENSGLDWGNVANYHSAATADPQFSYDGRYNKNLVDQAMVDVKYTTNWSWPTWFQMGPKITESTYVFQNTGVWQLYNYIGPGGGPGGSWGLFPSAFQFDPGNGAFMSSDTGATPAVQNHNQIGYLFKADPQDFVQAGTAGAYLAAFVTNPRYVREQVNAGYWMFDTKPTPRLELQAGVRYEKTVDEVKNIQSLGTAQVVAAGFPVTASTGVASTIPGINYQYFTLPRSVVAHNYNDFFPDASVKYNFTHNLVALAGYSYTVTRPSYADIAGAVTEDDTNNSITIPNTALLPQYANNYSVRLMDYFEPVGSFGVSVFENDFKNYNASISTPAPQDAALLNANGFGGSGYANYSVTTKINLPGTVVFRGATLEYAQNLPAPFDRVHVFANYTRLYTKIDGVASGVLFGTNLYNFGWISGVSPNVVSYGIGDTIGRVSFNINARWQDRTPFSPTYNVWEQQNTKVALSFDIRLTDHISLTGSARNIFNVPDYTYLASTPNRSALIFSSTSNGIEYYGAYYYAGIKATF